jgi:hypothetical protein
MVAARGVEPHRSAFQTDTITRLFDSQDYFVWLRFLASQVRFELTSTVLETVILIQLDDRDTRSPLEGTKAIE